MSGLTPNLRFLSSNAQDFIEEPMMATFLPSRTEFLSSNAQDFIEERPTTTSIVVVGNS